MRFFRPKEAELDGACGAEDDSDAHGRERMKNVVSGWMKWGGRGNKPTGYWA